MVAEAGWLAQVDHGVIAHTLARRWKRARVRYPHLRFVDVVRGYAAGLGEREAATRRQRWVRALPMVGKEEHPEAPEGWPVNVSWPRHVGYWREVLRRAALFGAGRLPDPSRGRAWHWGSCDARLPDLPRALRMVEAGRWAPLEIEGARNCFYTLATREGRS